MMKNDLETFSYPEQAFGAVPDPYSPYPPPYMGQGGGGGGYPSATMGLTSAGTAGSAFNVVQSATSSFASHPSYQSTGQSS